MNLCEKCGQVHMRCSAHRKRVVPPVPCMRNPLKGASVCPAHGGATAAGRAKARERVATAEAEAVVRRLLDRSDAEPIRDPAGALERLAGRMEWALDEIGRRVNDLNKLGVRGANGGETLKAEADIWLRLMGQLQSALATLGRFDLDERRLRVDAAVGGQILRALEWQLGELVTRLDLSDAERVTTRGVSVEMLRMLNEGRFVEGVADKPLPLSG